MSEKMTLSEWIRKNGDMIVTDEMMQMVTKPDKKRKLPEYEEDYWILNQCGAIVKSVWLDDSDDAHRTKFGNVFFTEEEAKAARERLKIRAELLDLGGRETFKPGERNYLICYIHSSDEVTGAIYTDCDHGTIYFDTEEETDDAIETIGKERLKKYWFRVEE